MTDEQYNSISEKAVDELEVKGSKFIARAMPVSDREQAEDWVKKVTEEFNDATHNCFAYKIGVGDSAIIRFRDAGEPVGTAGRPILQAIDAKDLTNIVLVVTRYFGGTKLGVGGLRRAYGDAAAKVLDRATIIQHVPKVRLRLVFSYAQGNTIHHILEKFDARILKTDFESQTSYFVELNSSKESDFITALTDSTAGEIVIQPA